MHSYRVNTFMSLPLEILHSYMSPSYYSVVSSFVPPFRDSVVYRLLVLLAMTQLLSG